MRLKKVFAGALAAAMLVCAVAVPAFAAEEVEQENGLTSSYVQMNIPYADFYKAVGVDNASEIDAVTSATMNKPRAGKLVAGSYHVNADGTDITGVSFPVKVLTPWALKNAKQVTDADSYDITVTLKGKESTTTYTGADALFENESYAYYKLSETPAYYITAWYDLLSGKWEFGKVHAAETTVEGATVELTTADGSEYGLHHVTNIWRGTELGFNTDASSARRLLRSPSTPPTVCMFCRSMWRCEVAESCLIQPTYSTKRQGLLIAGDLAVL